jgi:Ca-activated chloride channel family protein
MSLDFGMVHLRESWLLMLLLPVAWLVWRRLVERAQRAASLGVREAGAPETQVMTQSGLLLLVLALALLACLRPYRGSEEVEISLPAGEIAIAVDVSNSMYAADVSPSRLGLAKRKIDDFLRQLANAGRRDRVSIIIFSGAAQLFAPMTADYTVLRTFVRALSPELIRQGGSDPVAGMRAALGSFTERTAGARTVILFTDGADGDFEVSAVSEEVRQHMARVVVLGLGGKEAVPLTLPDGQPVRDRAGAVVRTALTEDALRALVSEINGGPGTSGQALYLKARVDDGDIERVRSFIAEHAPGQEAETSVVQTYGELGPLVLGFLSLLLVLMVGIGKRRLVFPCLLIVCAHGSCLRAEAEAEITPHAGWTAYAAEDYEGAEAIFSELLATKDRNDALLLQGLASAQYKRGRFAEAERTFDRMSKVAEYREQRFDAEYNKGNSQFAQGKFKEAIQSYDEALRIFPDDVRARENRALAERQLSEPPPETRSESSSPGSQSSSGSSSSSVSESEDGSESQGAGDDAADQTSKDQSSPAQSEERGEQTESADAGSQDSESARDSAESTASEGGDPNDPTGSQQSVSKGGNHSGEARSSAQDPNAAESSPSSGDISDRVWPDTRRTHDDTALRAQEAEKWLETLPDSPMLMPKAKGHGPAQGVRSW